MRQDELYLLDRPVAARKADRFAKGIDFDQFMQSDLRQNAIRKVLEIIGEAASRLGDETKSAHAAIPWAEIVGLRNRIVHGYFEVDMIVVWNIVQDDVPELIRHLAKIAPAESG